MKALSVFLESLPTDDKRSFIVVAAAFLVQFSVWGVRASLTTFTHAVDRDERLCTCYDTMPLNRTSPNATQELTDIWKCCDDSGIVATAVGISNGTGPIFGMAAGYLSGRFGSRPLLLISSVCCAASLLLSTWANSHVSFLLAYGPLMGISSGFMVTPGAFAVGTRFERLLPLAMGILYGGGGLGSALIPRLAGELLTNVYQPDEWRVVQQYISIFSGLCLVMCVFVVERRQSLQGPSAATSPTSTGEYNSLDATEEGAAPEDPSLNATSNPEDPDADGEGVGAENFTLLKRLVFSWKFFVALLCATLYGYSYYSALFCLVPYARAHGDPTSGSYSHYPKIDLDEATNMMLFFGVAQCVASVVLGFVSTKLNYYWTNFVCSLGSVGVLVAIPFCHTFATIGTMCTLFGVFSAGCRLCFPSMIANMFLGPCLGSLMGLALMGYGLGALPGPPLTAKITSNDSGNYSIGLFLTAGCVGLYGIISQFALQRWAVAKSASNDEIEKLIVESHRYLDTRGSNRNDDTVSEKSQLKDIN